MAKRKPIIKKRGRKTQEIGSSSSSYQKILLAKKKLISRVTTATNRSAQTTQKIVKKQLVKLDSQISALKSFYTLSVGQWQRQVKKYRKSGTTTIRHTSGVIYSSTAAWKDYLVAAYITASSSLQLQKNKSKLALKKKYRKNKKTLVSATAKIRKIIDTAKQDFWLELAEILHGSQSIATTKLNSAGLQRPPRRKTNIWRLLSGVKTVLGKLLYPFRVLSTYYPWQIAISLTVTVVILSSAYGVFVYIFKDLPDVKNLVTQSQPLTTKILDRHGKVLYRLYKDESRTLISLNQVPINMVHATIAIEDQDFYQHWGYSLRGIVRAVRSNLRGESIQGGSTITQQLVKNRLLSSERTLQRKIRELVLAILVDGTYSKDEILEMYFNEVAYGGSTYGVEEAAQRYFGKAAKDLTLAESALLAGLPAAPSAYNPFGPTPELAYARQEEVLRRMVEDEYITVDQAEAAKKEPLQFRSSSVDIRSPHFVMYVKQLLAEQYGEDMVESGGLEITTTLDLELQDKAQKIITDEINKLLRLRITNGASLVTNPQTGEVLAMVGSKDYFDFAHDGQVNVTLRPRQPGSSIKPLTYAAAFERGKSPSSVEDDAPITYHLPNSRPYTPRNYDGRFHGRVTLREALASSYNIPAVKMLAWVGLDAVIDKAESMGITTWGDRKRFGLSLTLGGGEVLMIDMAKLYGTFATQGYTTDINPILEVKDAKGTVLYRNDCALDKVACPKRKTLDTRVAYQITDVLSDNGARTPVFGPRSHLFIPNQQVAVKTGTTNSLRDNWTIGYTTDRLVAVWVGNNDNRPMSYVASGITGASPIWNSTMRLLLDDANPHKFAGPEGMIKVSICARTGTLPCQGCPAIKDEYFVPGTEPKQACSPAQFAPKPSPNPDGQPGQQRDQILEGASFE